MSLITRCVHCHSVFRITPEQLQAHGGQVRCGRCMQVFNGLAALTPDSPPMLAAMPAAAASELAAFEPGTTGPVSPPDAVTATSQSVDPDPVVVAEIAEMPAAESIPAAELIHAAESDLPPDDPLREAVPEPELTELPGPMPRAEAEQPAEAAMDGDNPFVQEAPAAAEPSRTRQPLLIAASVLLMLTLVAQVVFFYRGEIAARNPLARQWLNDACAGMGCRVQLPQRPKAVLIEASDLQVIDPERPSRIQLTATLRNHAGHDLAYPALDLVLTNVNDHTLVRRIFLPAEYLGAQRDARAGIAANAELTVRLALEIGNLGAAGFRLAVLPAPPL